MKQPWFGIVGVVLVAFVTSSCQAQESIKGSIQEYVPILSKGTLKNWEGDSRFWRVEDGIVIGETSENKPAEENTFLIWKGSKPADFEIKFEYRFVKVGDELSGNSGLQFRSERLDSEGSAGSDYRVRGYQADFAVSDWISGIQYEERGRGILARRGQKVVIDAEGKRHEERFAEEGLLGKYITHSDWNEYYVYANGDTLRAQINGQLMHEVIDQSSEARQKGILAFQIHTGPPMRVELKNIRLKVIN